MRIGKKNSMGATNPRNYFCLLRKQAQFQSKNMKFAREDKIKNLIKSDYAFIVLF